MNPVELPVLFGEYLAANLFGTVRLMFQIISVLFFGVFCYVFWRWWKVPPWPKPHENAADVMRKHHGSQSRIAKQWTKIHERLEEPAEAEWKVAVIEADMLIDDVLRRMEYPGESMGERLKNVTKEQVTTLDQVWEAHKLRNRIVHDPDVRILHRDARAAISQFEAFLREMNLIA